MAARAAQGASRLSSQIAARVFRAFWSLVGPSATSTTGLREALLCEDLGGMSHAETMLAGDAFRASHRRSRFDVQAVGV